MSMANNEIHFDGLSMFLGRKYKFFDQEDLEIISPKLDQIADLGENLYNLYIIFATFDVKRIFKIIYQASDEDIEKLSEYSSYEVLINDQTPDYIIENFCIAFEFFTNQKVYYESYKFLINKKTFICKENYKEIVEIIKKYNCVSDDKEENLKFNNERVKQKWKKMQELKKKHNINKQLTLKDICSILCNAEGNGINIFNVGELTIYQVYEHFERLGIKEGYKQSLMLWANTFQMNENGKVQEWMVRGSL